MAQKPQIMMKFRRLDTALFSRPYLLLRCKGPRCSLLHRKVVDTMRPLQRRPRLGLQHRVEENWSERYGLLKSPMPSPNIMRKKSRDMGVSFQKPRGMTYYGTLVRFENSSLNSP
jgi:hypothetical protein